jgi:PII-like signaling protein
MRVLDGEQFLVRIFLGESDQFHHTPLPRALVERLRREGFAGATVIHGVAGFGASSVIHTASLVELSTDLPAKTPNEVDDERAEREGAAEALSGPQRDQVPGTRTGRASQTNPDEPFHVASPLGAAARGVHSHGCPVGVIGRHRRRYRRTPPPTNGRVWRVSRIMSRRAPGVLFDKIDGVCA